MSKSDEKPINYGRTGRPLREGQEGTGLVKGGQEGLSLEGTPGTPQGILPPRGGSVMSKPQTPPPVNQQGGEQNSQAK
jgi:hypothetical protein